MKYLRILLILITAALAFSGTFEITEELKELPTDITALTKGKPDVNGNPCALIKLFSNIDKDLIFENRNHLEDAPNRGQGEYWLYMRGGARNIAIKKEGFMPVTYPFPIQLEQGKTYRMSLQGIEEEKKLEEITINLIGTPENSTIFLDGVEKGKVKSIMTSVGKHELKVTRDGFQTYTKTIEVSADKTLFNYKLEKVEDALIEINSNPPGAVVYIDGVRIGETPVPGFYPAGTYKIKLVHSDDYEDIEETIDIKSPETKKTYQLTDIRATLTINTHEKAKVFINGQEVNNYKNIKLPPQLVTVKVEMNKAKPLEEKLILAKKDNKTLDMHPEISTGTIQIALIPSDAEVELWEEGGERYTNTGSKSFTNVPVGTYKLKVSKKGFKTLTEDIRLTDGAIERKSIRLDEGSDGLIEMVFVQGGTFQMGSNSGSSDEKPVHSVTVSDFRIGMYEITESQYDYVMKGKKYSKPKNLPVNKITWLDAVRFCNKLSEMEGLQKVYTISGTNVTCNWNANGYRLPTEAEWEYAARGGNQSRGYEYSGSNILKEVGNNRFFGGRKAVGSHKPNELGIYDMSGNVWEWCWDWYASYPSGAQTNPRGPSSGSSRVLRGGSWGYYNASYCRVANRYSLSPEYRAYGYGFRVVRLP